MSVHTAPELGATLLDGGRCRFVVWAPQADTVEVHIVAPQERMIPLGRSDDGYFEGVAADVGPGARYSYRLDGNRDRPDPASRFQPDGVHGPTQVTDPAFAWEDAAWRGLPLREQVFYELHVGTFTPEGTFDAVIPRLAALKALGVTTIELMPVAQFPGERNWGYDGVHLYAVQNSYGGPAGLKRLVNAAHREGLAVALDVVYNHLGPEGAYLGDFGPYFTDRYKTPWGGAVNFDGPQCDEVRRYFLGNALMWITECHIDALRLDALHAIIDMSAQPFLKQLTAAVHAAGERAGRQVQVIAEIDRNDPSFIRPPDLGGYGMDALWNDDFHHALRTLLTGDRDGYYRDFGTLDHLVKAINEGFVYTGQRSAFRERSYGASSREIPAERFVVFTQNHDQIGNRMRGDRLSQTQPPASLKLAAAIMLLSPYVPMLF
ncbi:MAG: malto-oligosyltrehalose trehalohydrolase, partial [Chloroflexi bacterium]|nr:malto-oligosyltrehalose trehalohydrolase [Chloroflexota bacterium]